MGIAHGWSPLRRTMYSGAGNVTRIVGSQVETGDYSDTRFGCARNGQTVSYAVGETWDWNGVPGYDPTNYNIVFAREFRYDGARQRYLNRELDAVSFMSGQVLVMEETWSDYDGDQIYADFTVDSGTVTVTAEYQPGMASSSAPLDPQGALYYHADHLGTTRLTTNHLGVVFSESAYTAFGERHSGMNNRYGYAGAWGYQSHNMDEVDPPLDPATIFPYLHVGATYYDPATGRFLQRDPIGIRGGLNVYAYVLNRPTGAVDPAGKGWFRVAFSAVGGLVGGTLLYIAAITTAPAWVPVVGLW